jgi:DNA-binding IclR family transcriptional regulator
MQLQDNLVPTAEKTLRFIELLLDEPEGLTPQELLAELDMPRSSFYLLLRSLKNLGYVEQFESRGRYRAGARLDAWRGGQSQGSRDLLAAFYQEAGRRKWQETVGLVSAVGDLLQVLAQVEGERTVRSVLQVGQLTRDFQAAWRVLQTEPDADVRGKGFCLESSNERIDLALPVCRDGTHPDAALILSAPKFRYTPDGFLDENLNETREMAARLSYQLGANAYTPYRQSEDSWRNPQIPLPAEQIKSFLNGPWSARLACLRPDGTPHVIPVWQEWDGKAFSVIAWQGSQWADYVQQNPNVSLTVDEPWQPLRRVVARGNAERVVGNPADLSALIARLMRRYLGRESTELNSQIACAFRIVPLNMSGWQGLPGQETAS